MPATAHVLPVPQPDGPAFVEDSSGDPAAAGLESLRAQVADVVRTSRPAGPAWPTGVPSLDAALGGGLPRGRITEVVGALGAGRATLLRGVIRRVLDGGGWVAWIDARRTAAPQSWVGLGKRLVMVRPPDARRGAWCADQLLRSGVFALVVLDGAPPLQRVQGVRLSGLARERDAAFVIVADNGTTSRIGGAMRLRIESAKAERQERGKAGERESGRVGIRERVHETQRGFSVIVEKGAALRTVEVKSAVVVARRMCTDSEIPDRRGVARGARRAWTARGGHTDAAAPGITWGGLGASVGDPHGRVIDPAAEGTGSDTARPPLSRRDVERAERELDRRTRDWTAYRGRRRAGESSYGRHSRRDIARERLAERTGHRSHTKRRARQGAALGHAPASIG
jgi:recombination protein RecA